MDNFGHHCRLCLGTVSDEHFKEINDDMKSIFDFLLLKLNLENSSKYIMCNICSRKVMEAFTFKSLCVDANNTIIRYVDDETRCSINLNEMYAKETGNKQLISTLDIDYNICRFCMQLVKYKFIPAHEMAVDMIKIYVPEINLTIVKDPVICKQCFDSFVRHSNFIMNCLEVNERIKSFCGTEVADDSIWMPSVDSYIKTEEVLIKTENEHEDEWLETDSAMARLVYEGISDKINYSEIKTEDEDEKSEAAPLLRYNNLSESKVFECDTCDYKTKRKGDLKIHQLTHKDFSEIKLFKCDTCDYLTKYKNSLKQHQLIHKDIFETELFECDTCDHKTKLKGNLKRHQLTHKVISETEPFECDACDFKTKRKGNLKTHQWRHKDISETEVFECDTCDFKTKYKNSYKQHQLTHKDTSEMEVFVCDTCGHKTKQKANLKVHLLTHKDIYEMEAFECDTCDYKTKRKSDLKIHQLTHQDISVFECNTCDFKTKYKKSLKGHQLTHKDVSEREVFECEICDFKTKYKNSLKKHLLTHDGFGAELFVCDRCGHKFKRKDRLEMHILRKHEDLKL